MALCEPVHILNASKFKIKKNYEFLYYTLENKILVKIAYDIGRKSLTYMYTETERMYKMKHIHMNIMHSIHTKYRQSCMPSVFSSKPIGKRE